MLFIEGSPLKEFRNIPVEQLLDPDRLQQLEHEFPGKVILLPQGSKLFQYSKNLSALLKQNRFDRKFSGWYNGALFFSDVPVLNMTNCQTIVSETLGFLSHDDLSNTDWEKLRKIGGILSGGAKLGYDGYISLEGDSCTELEEGYAAEVVVFQESLHKLGAITPYPMLYD